jgi:FHA domain
MSRRSWVASKLEELERLERRQGQIMTSRIFGGLSVRETASTNGTFVNGQRVIMADLDDGDTIRGGRTAMDVTIGAEAGSPPHDRSNDPVADSVAAPTCPRRSPLRCIADWRATWPRASSTTSRSARH